MSPALDRVNGAPNASPAAHDPGDAERFGFYDRIADYYDVIYAGKDYAAECRFLLQVWQACQVPVRSLLDLGCGTGAHAGILDDGCADAARGRLLVTGIDRSAAMLSQARRKFPHVDFRLGDILTYRAPERYDAAIAMFGVLGHVRTQDLHRAFRTANHHLRPGGLFVFDGWHRPAVMRARPPRGKLASCEEERPGSFPVFRYVEMSYCADDDTGSAEYIVIDLERRVVIRDRHKVSLLTRERVRHACRTAGFTLSSYSQQFALDRKPGTTDWKVSVVLQKVADVPEAEA